MNPTSTHGIRAFPNRLSFLLSISLSVAFGISNVGRAQVVFSGNYIGPPNVLVGNTGAGALSITNGSALSDTFANIGNGVGVTGTVTVGGAGSQWTNSSSLSVGNQGVGSLGITNGGTVTDTSGTVGDAASGNGTVTVGGSGSQWTNSSYLTVGNSGTGTLSITNGGTVTDNATGAAFSAVIGDNNGTAGTVSVAGTASQWINNNGLRVGYAGNGTLAISAGGVVSVSGAPNSVIGARSGSNGAVTVDGSGSQWTNAGYLYVGNLGTGTLGITSGGAVSDTVGVIGELGGGSGAVTVGGTNSLWTNSSSLTVGAASAGSLAITSGGKVTDTSATIGNNSGVTGTVTVGGSGSQWTNSGSLTVGSLGTGSLGISNGGSVSSVGTAIVGSGISGTGTVSVDGSGSSWTNSGRTVVGNAGTGGLGVSNGGTVTVNGGAGTLTLGAGSTGVGTLDIGGAASGPALAGGIINAAVVTTGSGAGTVQFNTTGISSARYNFTQDGTASGRAIAITGATQVVNTEGYNVLTGTNTYTGATTVNGGTLAIGTGGSLRNSSIANNGGSLVVSSGASIGGAGSLVQSSGSTEVDGGLTRDTIQIMSGSALDTGSIHVLGNASNSGNITVSGPSAVFDVNGVYEQSQTSGYTQIQSGGTLSANAVQLMGGTIQVDGTLDPASIEVFAHATLEGTGHIAGNVTNDGTVILGDSPNAPGTLSEFGNYTQNADGTLDEGIINAGSNGIFDVTGNLNLGGDLNIGLLGGFNPSNDELFTLFNFTGTEVGAFSGITGSDANDWTVLYDANNIELEFKEPTSSVPEPSVWLDRLFLALVALSGPMILKRRNAAPAGSAAL